MIGLSVVSLTLLFDRLWAQANEVVGLWHFDENGGSIAYDSSGAGNDAANRLVETKYAYGTDNDRTESFTYDNMGNTLSKTLRSGETITYEYDLLNRQTKKILPGDPAPEVDFVYDDLGRMTSVTDESGATTFVHDDANRLLSITYPDGKIVSHEYDLVGNRTKLTYSDSTWIDYTYDDLNRMNQVKAQSGEVLADYTYDTLRRTRLDYLNSTHVTYDYNDANWVTALYNTKTETGDISSFTYIHDDVGNRITMTTAAGIHTYTYDNIYQLTNVDYPDGPPFEDKTYNYDPVGNRDSVENGEMIDYENNELNEYTSVASTRFNYDLRGNLTSDSTNTYTYNYENHLTAVVVAAVPVGQYKYDPFGKRIETQYTARTTRYVYSGDQVIEEWEGESLARKFIYGMGIDEPLVMETEGNRYYYHFDGLGSVRNLTDSAGSTAASYEYDVYGAFHLTGSSHGNPYTFTGRRYDPESGLYYYRARYYSPAVGRFLQTDPMGYDDSPNLYTYVTNNPVNWIDPFGLQVPGGIGPGDLFTELWDLVEGHKYEEGGHKLGAMVCLKIKRGWDYMKEENPCWKPRLPHDLHHLCNLHCNSMMLEFINHFEGKVFITPPKYNECDRWLY